MKDSPFLKIVACLLGGLVALGQFASCQQQAQMNNYYNDQMQQNMQMQQDMYQGLQNQNQTQQQEMQQLMNQFNGGAMPYNGYGPRSSPPAQPTPQ